MAQTVSELLVRTRAEGVDETAEDLERQSDAFEGAADAAKTETGVLERFQNRWQGAMSAIVAGLAIAAAGLLSRVPVIKETMSGLEAVIDAVALRLDSKMRPAINGLNQDLFDLANAIASGEGEFDAFMQVLGRVMILIGQKLPAAFGTPIIILGQLVRDWESVWGRIQRITSRVTTRINNIFGDWKGVFLVGWTIFTDILQGRWGKALRKIIAIAKALLPDVAERWEKMKEDIKTKLRNLVTDAFNKGRDMVQGFIDGLKSKFSRLREWANRVAGIVRDHLPGSDAKTGPLSDLSKTGPALVDTFADGMDAGVGRLERSSGRVASAAAPGGQASRGAAGGGGQSGVMRQLSKLVTTMQNNRQEHVFQVDGKELARIVSPMIGQGAVEVGATGVRR